MVPKPSKLLPIRELTIPHGNSQLMDQSSPSRLGTPLGQRQILATFGSLISDMKQVFSKHLLTDEESDEGDASLINLSLLL